MSNKFQGAVTTVGTDLINQAIVNNTKMQFLRVIGSSTVYTAGQLATLDDTTITGASHNQDGHVSNVTRKDKTTIATELVLDGSNVKADYQLNTILILATVDGKDHLFAALKANQAQYMNAYDGNEAVNLQVNCSFKIANTDHVDITVDSAGTLTVDDYNRLHDYTDKVGKDTGVAANSYTDSKVAAASSAATAANTDEAAARSAADSVASASLAAEVKARAAADTTNSTAASSAAASLATQITNNKSVFNTYSSAANSSAASMTAAITANSTAANSAVAAEAAARTKADTTEVTARSAADKSLASSVAANASAIATNSTAAKSYAASAATSAAGVGTVAANSAAASAKAAVTAESTARNNAVVAETNARSSADAELQSQITANKSAAASSAVAAQTAANNAQTTANGKMTINPVAIAANTDLNTIQTAGYYSAGATTTSTLKNCPIVASAIGLVVLKMADMLQIVYEYAGSSKKAAFRKLISGVWTPWSTYAQLEADQTFTGKQTFTQAPLTKLPKDAVAHAIVQADVGNGPKNVVTSVAGADASGDGISFGTGGLTIIGAGEAAQTYLAAVIGKTVPSQLSVGAAGGVQAEYAAVVADGSVALISNYQNAASARLAQFDVSGNFKIPGNFTANNNLPVATQQWVNTNMSNALALKEDIYDSGWQTAGFTLLNGAKWEGTDATMVGHYRIIKVGKTYMVTIGGSVTNVTKTGADLFTCPAKVPWPSQGFNSEWFGSVDGGTGLIKWGTGAAGASPTFKITQSSATLKATDHLLFHLWWFAKEGWMP